MKLKIINNFFLNEWISRALIGRSSFFRNIFITLMVIASLFFYGVGSFYGMMLRRP